MVGFGTKTLRTISRRGARHTGEGRRLMKKQKIIIWIIAMLAACVAIVLLSCGDDTCPTCPKDEPTPPYNGWLYVPHDAGYVDMWRIDTETGEQYDSVLSDGDFISPGDVAVTPDGRYLALSLCCNPWPQTITRIYDAQTLALLHTIPTGMHPIFPSQKHIMVGFSYRKVWIYSVPEFELVFSDSIGMVMFPEIYEKDNLIYGSYVWGTDRIDSIGLIVYDYLRREIVSLGRVYTDDGVLITDIGPLDIHPDGKRIFFLAGDPFTIYAAFYGLDLETRSVFLKFPMFSTYGDVTITPDGKQVYVTDSGGDFIDIPTPGTIFIFDTDDGEYIDGISLVGYVFDDIMPGIPQKAREIVFTPTGERAFVALRENVAMIDTKERRIISVLWPDRHHSALKLALGPKL